MAFRMTPQLCPECKAVHDAATTIWRNVRPTIGDFTVCGECGVMLRFGLALELQIMKLEELEELEHEQALLLIKSSAAIRLRSPRDHNVE